MHDVSGQLGATADGHLHENAGMEKTDPIDVLVLLSAPEVVPAFREVRDRVRRGTWPVPR